MNRGLFTILFFLIAFYAAHCQVPSGYYDPANGLSGDALKAALNDIIDGHVELSYTQARDALKVTDEDTLNSNNVICFYTGWSYGKSAFGNGSEEWNREHVWSKSHGDFANYPPEGTDVHMLRPTDASVNSAKNNRDFDVGITQYIDGSGATECYYYTDAWEPRDEVKGDVARIIFYMATRYEGENYELDLEIVDYVNTAPNNEPHYGKLLTLLQWHQNDSVDSWEISRNDVVYYSYQNNRNPYVDHPEYVDSIWGSPNNPEPSNHVASFAAGSPSSSTITLTWNDNDGTNLASKYLVMINTTGTFTPPVDSVENSDDTDITDGSGQVNVSHGVENYTFTALYSNTAYYFEIYPYANFGTNIDYKTDDTVPNSSDTTSSTNLSLIISEVSDPKNVSNSKFVELYNAGSGAIDFNDNVWYLCRQANGSYWGDVLLTGSINAGETYVLSYNSSSFLNSYGFNADKNSGNISGNGDDGYFLYSGGGHSTGLLIDSYGVIDQDGTGEDWEYSNSKAVRKYIDTIPSTTWQAPQWTIIPNSNDDDMNPDRHRSTLNWTGAQSSAWETSGNWMDGVGTSAYSPDAGYKITIPTTSTSPTISSEAHCGCLELESGATLTISSGSLRVGR